MPEPVSVLAALLAGMLSFISPCVLPIVPGYLSFISGINLGQLKGGEAPAGLARRVGITSVAFVLGFSTVFVSLGAAATLVPGWPFRMVRPTWRRTRRCETSADLGDRNR